MQTANGLRAAILAGAIAGSIVSSALTSMLFLGERKLQAQDATDKAQQVTATSFRLVDKDGKLKGVFDVSDNGDPTLELYDQKGFASLTIGLRQDRAGISISGSEQEDKRATLLLGVDGSTPQIGLASRTGEATAFLSVEDGKFPRLQLIKIGHRGESAFSTFAALHVAEEGSLLLLAPVHEVTSDEEDAPTNTVIAGRTDFETESYGIRLKGKDKDTDWPSTK
ncbi:MAG: hypothetical protein H6839_16600 [Planctomycetes bacterium]|nr:hypothetical protein [Planctomycetota bacterium]